MTYCEQCGSTSHDEQGFCRGCGTRLPGFAPDQPKSSAATHPLAEMPQLSTRRWGIWGFTQPEVKNVWVAVLLALFLGPFGMTYSTYLGALVMLAVSVFAVFYLDKVVTWILLPVACAVWAGLAARSANSIY